MKRIFFLFCIPLSFIYFLLISLRNIFYTFNIFRKYRLNAKVISVGNVTWGGTGKTPVVAFIADLLTKKNHVMAILIRGYGNDESELLPKLTSNIPVLVGKDRVRNGREAVERHLADTILLDDGFQYRRLIRDLDIVCIDATNPFGNGWLIPTGSMREPKLSLKRADIFLITKVDLVCVKDRLKKLEDKLRRLNPKAVIVKAIHRPLYLYKVDKGEWGRMGENGGAEEKVNIDQLKNKEIVLISAIGSPVSFEKTILRLGLKIKKHFIFRDHHCYTKYDVAQLDEYCKKNKLDTVITTEKDAVKLRGLWGRIRGDEGEWGEIGENEGESVEYLVLKVRLEIIENEDGFYNRLFGIYNS